MKSYEELIRDRRVLIRQRAIDGCAGTYKAKNTEGTVVASWGGGWEHVSIRPYNGKMPTWDDMCIVKDIFWREDDCVVQYHPPKSEYVNNVPNCLHLCKPIGQDLPMPPSFMVGIKGVELA